MALWATGAICQTAQRKTERPSCSRAGQTTSSPAACASRTSSQERLFLMASHCPPSLPHTVGPMPGTSEGPTTTAPAPSAKRKAVERSVRSVKSVSFSAPTTSTWRAVPPRTRSLAWASAWQNPAQPAETSQAAAGRRAQAVRRGSPRQRASGTGG